jgi:LmbE family N-acetylglucosaminyl deacetylase
MCVPNIDAGRVALHRAVPKWTPAAMVGFGPGVGYSGRMDFKRAMVVFAHPDDAEFGSAGTVGAWTRAGTEVAYLCVTDGSAGSNEPGVVREELARVREAEQRAACDVLGVAECTFLGIPDGMVELTFDLRRNITREVRRFRPDVLMVPDPTRFWDAGRRYINHIDHRTVGQACMAVVNPDSSTRPQFPELLDEGFEPFEIRHVWIPTWDDADTYVDITETIETKIEALRCHQSQIHDMPVDDWIRSRAKERGAERGLEYAECYRTFRLREDPEQEMDEEAESA